MIHSLVVGLKVVECEKVIMNAMIEDTHTKNPKRKQIWPSMIDRWIDELLSFVEVTHGGGGSPQASCTANRTKGRPCHSARGTPGGTPSGLIRDGLFNSLVHAVVHWSNDPELVSQADTSGRQAGRQAGRQSMKGSTGPLLA